MSPSDHSAEADPVVVALVRDIFSLVVDRAQADEASPDKGKGAVEADPSDSDGDDSTGGDGVFALDDGLAAPITDSMCSICLDDIPLQDTALVKGCEHAYCVTCILRWAKRKQCCPKCKSSFDYLWTYRTLDGELNDYLVEESVCLLQRAFWLEPEDGPQRFEGSSNYDDSFYPEDYDDDDEDYDDEDIYMDYGSSRRTRVVLGNRRWGANGYVASGRMSAAPILSSSPGGASSSTSRPQAQAAGKAAASPCSPPGSHFPVGAPPGSVHGGKKKKAKGRRALRAEKRAAADVGP